MHTHEYTKGATLRTLESDSVLVSGSVLKREGRYKEHIRECCGRKSWIYYKKKKEPKNKTTQKLIW